MHKIKFIIFNITFFSIFALKGQVSVTVLDSSNCNYKDALIIKVIDDYGSIIQFANVKFIFDPKIVYAGYTNKFGMVCLPRDFIDITKGKINIEITMGGFCIQRLTIESYDFQAMTISTTLIPLRKTIRKN